MIVGLQANFFDDAQEDKSAVVRVKSRKQGHAENICKVKPEMQASQAKRERKRGSTSLQHVALPASDEAESREGAYSAARSPPSF